MSQTNLENKGKARSLRGQEEEAGMKINKIEEATRFAVLNKNSATYAKDYKKQWDKASVDVKQGKMICLSDLMINSKNC